MKRAPGQPSPIRSLWARYRDLSFGIKMSLFMVVGVGAGLIFGERAAVLQPLGDLFIRMLIMGATPLVFFNLLAGITAADNPRLLGRLGWRIAIFYLLTMVVALSLGLLVIHLLQPGVGMPLKGTVPKDFGNVPKVVDMLLDLLPSNVFQAFASGNITQVVVFGLILGVTTLCLPAPQRHRLSGYFQLGADVFRKMVALIILLAPLGVGVLAATTVGRYGRSLFGPLMLFIGGVWLAQALMGVFYLAVLYAFTRQSPLDFLKKTGPVYATAAATCSSLASVGVAFEVAETRLRLPRSVYAFTITLGSQFNKDGTTVMLSSILLFTAQAAGVHFSWPTILEIILVGLLLSAGIGGVPGAGLVVATIFVKAFNLPVEVVLIVAGVYRFFDMSNTVMNLMGDMVGTCIIARFEPTLTEPSSDAGTG